MAKWGRRVGFGLRVTGKKWVILSGLKTDLGQSGCRLGRVDPYFSHEFIYLFLFFYFYKENTCICPLESYATNYLM